MKDSDHLHGPAKRSGARPVRTLLATLWPQAPLATLLAVIGLLNVLAGLNLSATLFQRLRALDGIARSLSAFGGTMQAILGLMLVVVGTGLWWRLVSAWTLSVLLLAVMLGINVARAQWGWNFGLELALLGAVLFAKHRFTRRTVLARLVFSLSSILAVLAYGVFGSYLLGAGFNPPIRDLDTATYFAVTALSTVGFGDFVPVTPETRWFVVSLLVIGLGVFATAIASTLGPKISVELNRLLNPREKPMEAKNHIILVGEGAIARNTAKELKRRGVPFIHILTAKAEADALGDHVIEGDATNDAILRQAGIQQARLVIAAREDDGDNAFISLGAKDLNPNVRVLAVASSALSIRRLKLARADLVFSPAAVGSRLLADLVEGDEILPEFRDLLEGDAQETPSREAAMARLAKARGGNRSWHL